MSPRQSTSDPLLIPAQYIKGIGPRRAGALEAHGIRTVHDLLFHVPRRYLDRTSVVTVSELRRKALDAGRDQMTVDAGVEVGRRDYTVVGEVRSFKVLGVGARARFVLNLGDSTGSMQCVWFGGVQYWKKAFTIGEVLAVSGQPSLFGGILQIVHPALDRISDSPDESESPMGQGGSVDWGKTLNTGGLIPLYPSGKELERVGLDSRGLRKVIHSTLHSHLDAVRETLPDSILRARQLLPLRTALKGVHFPDSLHDVEQCLRRLKYEELFYFQIALALRRSHLQRSEDGIRFQVHSKLARQLVDSLPFELTRAQIRVINEITHDMQSPHPMNRLLQGDVGSGKTIVALVAMLIAAENGYQTVFMAPTEILAEQHYKTIASFLTGIDVNIRFLVGGQRSALRRDVIEDIRRGSAQIVVGTHALFEKGVEFARLGLVVIDEQHRFGVMQRASLRQKGTNPDVLVMTATPIPRTLSLTIYGDLDLSIIDELPRGRQSIKTLIRYDDETEKVYDFIRQQVGKGRQAYLVYPLIEESEKVDLKAATVHFQDLQRRVFPDLRLGLLHGRMKSEEKDAIMSRFKAGEMDVLVATTVIEVGIDVPNATVMVIENAEQFGLSQLHQLRGRVGRGSEQSYCILLARKWIARRAERLGYHSTSVVRRGTDRLWQELEDRKMAERRLATMVSTTDGFKIAEVDLQLRGPGDFFGTRQSGMPEFRVADIIEDARLLDEARSDAFAIVAVDSRLRQPVHKMIADHLRAHHRDATSLLRVG